MASRAVSTTTACINAIIAGRPDTDPTDVGRSKVWGKGAATGAHIKGGKVKGGKDKGAGKDKGGGKDKTKLPWMRG